MKKKVGLILAAVAMCAFTACNQENAQSKTGEKGAQPEAAIPQAASA